MVPASQRARGVLHDQIDSHTRELLSRASWKLGCRGIVAGYPPAKGEDDAKDVHFAAGHLRLFIRVRPGELSPDMPATGGRELYLLRHWSWGELCRNKHGNRNGHRYQFYNVSIYHLRSGYAFGRFERDCTFCNSGNAFLRWFR